MRDLHVISIGLWIWDFELTGNSDCPHSDWTGPTCNAGVCKRRATKRLIHTVFLCAFPFAIACSGRLHSDHQILVSRQWRILLLKGYGWEWLMISAPCAAKNGVCDLGAQHTRESATGFCLISWIFRKWQTTNCLGVSYQVALYWSSWRQMRGDYSRDNTDLCRLS